MITDPVYTCIDGTNADLFSQALKLYVKPSARIADVTYGKGVFWRLVEPGLYSVEKSDLQDGVDFRDLPYEDESFDAFVLDPPYLNGGKGAKQSLNRCYKNPGHNSYQAVLRLYLAGTLEAYRVLRRNGIFFVKCQPCVADHRQYFTQQDLNEILSRLGFRCEDEFVLHPSALPMVRHARQQHARKNHSYLLVFRKVR